jgi:O-antigen biosynthesis protein WbqP
MTYRDSGKRVVDVCGAATVLVAASPVLAVAAAAIWIEDRHTPFFQQVRVGQNHKPFVLVKFRSMRVSTESVESNVASEAWITRVGRVLRRTNIDEVPQLWNVLRGDMSLIGPRPALPSQEGLVALRDAGDVYDLKPGLTGLAQVRAYDGMPDAEKAAHDAEYARRLTFLVDVGIVLRTLKYLTRRPPTY